MGWRYILSAAGSNIDSLSSGLLAVMQRLLNVEGYAILDRQDAANTVVLNIPLLKKQFELGQ